MQSMDVSIEDSDIHSKFGHILRDFRLKFGSKDLKSIAQGFKLICYEKISNNDLLKEDTESNFEDWILECKFWTMLENLLDIKFSNKEHIKIHSSNNNSSVNLIDDMNICEYSSETVIQDKIIQGNTELLELFTSINTLSETFQLDEEDHDEEEKNIQNLSTKKWMHSLVNLNNINPNEALVSSLDLDEPLRSNKDIHPTDVQNDESFFKLVFSKLLIKNYEEIKMLCKETNNWDFYLLIESMNDRIDPVIDLNDFSYNTESYGVKWKLLRRRTIYQLTQNPKIGPYEKACYGLLSSDFLSCNEVIKSWDEKLFVYLENLLKDKLENKILKEFENLGKFDEINLISKISKPNCVSNSIDDILNKLTNDPNTVVRNQSKHPIRVLLGSIISENVFALIENTIKSLDNLNSNGNEITSKGYLLRILTHLLILLQLIYGDTIIDNESYTKLINYYLLKLMLYKNYELIPIYVSFIPDMDEMLNIYAKLLFNYEFNNNERLLQIKNIRNLSLPLEDILRSSIEYSFNETLDYYSTKNEIQLNYEIDDIDVKLYSMIYWFIDSGMIVDCIDAIIVMLRRFLLVGKIGSSIQFLKSISLPKLIDNYKLKNSMDNDDEATSANTKILELLDYYNLFESFEMITDEVKDIDLIYRSLTKLLKEWLFDLIKKEDEDVEIFRELRRIYIPTIFNTLFDLLVENKLNDDAINLINLLSDDEFKLYDIFISTNELKAFLVKFAHFNCVIDNSI